MFDGCRAGESGPGANGTDNGIMSDDLAWQIFLVLAAGGTLLGFLVRSLLRYRGWWSAAPRGRKVARDIK